jgi:hypothetical protein
MQTQVFYRLKRRENYGMTQKEMFQPGSKNHEKERKEMTRNQKGKIVGRKRRL